jgi:hypothetical protein
LESDAKAFFISLLKRHAVIATTVVFGSLDAVESLAVADPVTLTKRAAVVLPIAVLASISTVGAPVVAIAIDPALTPMSCIVLAAREPVTMPGVVGTTLELAVVGALVVVMTTGNAGWRSQRYARREQAYCSKRVTLQHDFLNASFAMAIR